jgi:DNA-binding response OmpR family regulator
MDPLAPATDAHVIVVIDDDVPTRRVIGEILVDEGYDVVLWDGLSDPAAFVRDIDAATLIVDLHLGPRWSGWSVIEALRGASADGNRSLPVVVCTADQRALQEHGPALEAFQCRLVPKPFDLDDLTAAVQQSVASAFGG